MGQRAYEKLQYDLPLVSPEELEGLSDTLRASLQLKSGQPLLPITSKLLENVVAGARAPAPLGPAPLSLQPQSLSASTVAGSDQPGTSPSAGTAVAAVTAPPTRNGEAAPTQTSDGASDSAGAPAAAPPAPPAQEPLPSTSLVDTGLLNPDRQRLCGAFRSLCAVIFVPLVSHALAVSEQDTWGLLYGIGSGDEDDHGDEAVEDAEGAGGVAAGIPECSSSSGEPGADKRERQGAQRRSQEDQQQREQAAHSNGAAAAGAPNTVHGPGTTDAMDAVPAPGLLGSMGDERAGQPQADDLPQPQRVYEEPEAAEEDGDDFIFEDLEAPCTSASASTAAAAAAPSSCPGQPPASLPPPSPYSWPALRSRLLRLSGHVSYALLDDSELWRDGTLLQGVFQLLRALGAHRHCQELQPLLHAYVGLVADRIAAEPTELACLDNLWDAVGLHCVASLPQMGRQRAAAAGGAARGGQGLLLAEASTCLSLVASLAGQLTGGSAKLRLWQQVHKHMLPLLERCLGELARMVGPGKAAAKSGAPPLKQQQQQQRAEPKAPGPEEVAAIVLVCQVLDFYVQQRPGNADLAVSLKGTGVLASLCVLFAAAADLPGAEPLRSAALCCAASGRELHTWMMAVPGLAKALAGPHFQESGAHEAHGAVWELLGGGGSSPLALSILAGGAAPEKAARVHALLQLMARAAACQGGRSGPSSAGLWGQAVERVMRELFAALRQEQAGGAGAATGRAGAGAGVVRGAVGSQAQQEGIAASASEAAASVVVEEEEDDDDKLHLLDPEALQRRRARQLHPACWRILKQLLTTSGESSGKTD